MYADEAQLYKSDNANNINNLIIEANSNLVTVSEWSVKHGLILNPTKTVEMCIGYKFMVKRTLDIRIENIIINQTIIINVTESAKNLGVFIDQHFKNET